jgi:Mrp family chromosome partitioning ATPase/capsular polysaccharide biosynthesis protein
VAGSTVGAGSPPRSAAAVSLWRAKWAILAVIVLAFLGGYDYSKGQSATYSAESQIVLSAAQPFDPLGTFSSNDPTRYVADQAAIIQTQAILAPAAQALATATPPETIDPIGLGGTIAAEPSSSTSLIVVTATSPDPDQAVARANAVAQAYQAYQAAKVQGVVDASVGATRDPSVIENIRAQAVAYGTGVAFVEPAAPGTASSSLAPTRSALLITAVAALIAIGVALLWRTPPPDGSSVIRAARTRLLGTVGGRSLFRGSGSPAQQYALPMVALDYARQETPGPILITGVSTRSGTASAVHGLAASAAAQGHRVLVIDADPERRDLLRVSGAAPDRSLEQLDRPGVTRDEVLVPVPTSGGGQFHLAKVGTDRSPLVDGADITRSLAQLAGSFDLVLLQAGPVPRSPVAFSLLEQVAAVVLVARGRDTARSVTELRDRLDTARRPLIGLVLTGRRGTFPWSQGSVQPTAYPPLGRQQASPRIQAHVPTAATEPVKVQPPPADQHDQQVGVATH